MTKSPGLVCPVCNSHSHRVVETRKLPGVLSRVRECPEGHRFISEERTIRLTDPTIHKLKRQRKGKP